MITPDQIGVCVHYGRAGAYQDLGLIQRTLAALGVQHVRDARLVPGVETLVITTTAASAAATVSAGGTVEVGPNEHNLSADPNWVTTLRNNAQALSSYRTVGPGLGNYANAHGGGDYGRLGPLPVAVSNGHVYLNGRDPVAAISTQAIAQFRTEATQQPVWVTETGWSNGNIGGKGKVGVDEQTAADQLEPWLNLLFNAGAARVYLYELFDQPELTDPAEKLFGLARPDGTLKPIGLALQRLLNPTPTPTPEPTVTKTRLQATVHNPDGSAFMIDGLVDTVSAGPTPQPPDPPKPTIGPVVPAGYTPLFVSDFTDLTSVKTWDSTPAVNGGITAQDTTNKQLQVPVLAANTLVADDPLASQGKALQCHVQQGKYALPNSKYWVGSTAARCDIGPAFPLPGSLVLARIRSGPGDGKFAFMVWPATGWHWEIDFRERFNGGMGLSVNHHIEQVAGQGATPQIHVPLTVDPLTYHVYGVECFTTDGKTVSGVQYTIDSVPLTVTMPGGGAKVQTIVDPKWLPQTPETAVISIGSANPKGRAAPAQPTYDSMDWLQVLHKS